MTLCLDNIAIDPTAAESGVWMEYMSGRFLIARKTPVYDTRLVELYNADYDLVRSGTPEGNQRAAEITQELFAECILLDWDKIVDRAGNPVPYTKELGLQLIRDPRQYELVSAMERFSNHHKNFQAQVEAEVAADVKSSAAS